MALNLAGKKFLSHSSRGLTLQYFPLMCGTIASVLWPRFRDCPSLYVILSIYLLRKESRSPENRKVERAGPLERHHHQQLAFGS